AELAEFVQKHRGRQQEIAAKGLTGKARANAGKADPYGRSSVFEAEFTPWDFADQISGYEDSEFSEWTGNDALQTLGWILDIGGDPANLIGGGSTTARLASKNATRVRHVANSKAANVVARELGLAESGARELVEFATKNGDRLDKTSIAAKLI